jgi:hypothetical protein
MATSADATPTVRAAARVARAIAFLEIAVPVVFIVATIPGSLYFLLLGGLIVVAPLVAFGIVGLAFARSIERGHRFFGASLFELIQAAIFAGLALHSVTWDPTDRFSEVAFPIVTIALWCGVVGSISVPLLLVVTSPQPRYPGDERPALFPWLILSLLFLVLVAAMCGVVIPAEG